MNNSLSQKSNWNLITIDDPAFLQGQSIFDVLQLLLTCHKFKYVILYDIMGFAQNSLMAILKNKEDVVLRLEEIMESISDVRQFEWGDFFLFEEYPTKWDNPQDRLYPHLVEQSDTTVRAVDNQYIYIYTQSKVIVDALKKKYEVESIITMPLALLDYPY